jgi:hypothetical protein
MQPLKRTDPDTRGRERMPHSPQHLVAGWTCAHSTKTHKNNSRKNYLRESSTLDDRAKLGSARATRSPTDTMAVTLVLALAMAFTRAIPVSRCDAAPRAAPRQALSMSSGFGTKKIVGKSANPNQKPGVYEKLQKKVGGAPEYSIFVRQGEAAEWRDAGVLSTTARSQRAVYCRVRTKKMLYSGAAAT